MSDGRCVVGVEWGGVGWSGVEIPCIHSKDTYTLEPRSQIKNNLLALVYLLKERRPMTLASAVAWMEKATADEELSEDALKKRVAEEVKKIVP